MTGNSARNLKYVRAFAAAWHGRTQHLCGRLLHECPGPRWLNGPTIPTGAGACLTRSTHAKGQAAASMTASRRRPGAAPTSAPEFRPRFFPGTEPDKLVRHGKNQRRPQAQAKEQVADLTELASASKRKPEKGSSWMATDSQPQE
jgi:hypothetical protein